MIAIRLKMAIVLNRALDEIYHCRCDRVSVNEGE